LGGGPSGPGKTLGDCQSVNSLVLRVSGGKHIVKGATNKKKVKTHWQNARRVPEDQNRAGIMKSWETGGKKKKQNRKKIIHKDKGGSGGGDSVEQSCGTGMTRAKVEWGDMKAGSGRFNHLRGDARLVGGTTKWGTNQPGRKKMRCGRFLAESRIKKLS